MTNSARLSGRPSSSAAYNMGDVVDTPDSAIKSWRYLGAGEWEPNDAVRYTRGPGGGVAYPLQRNPGGGKYTIRDLLPKHRTALRPELMTTAGITTAPGVAVSIGSAAAGEWSRKDLVFTMAGATSTGYTEIPVAADVLGNAQRIGYHVHFRVYCDDWSKVAVFGLWPYFGTTANRCGFSIVSNGSPFGCTDPEFAAAWNGKYRTFQFSAPQRSSVTGAVPMWGVNDSSDSSVAITGIRAQIQTSGACVIKINRVYSSEWPCGTFTLIGDGAYNKFRENVLPEYIKRDWRGAVSLYKTADASPLLPSYANLNDFAKAGWDVYPHMRAVDGENDVPLTGTETSDAIGKAWAALADAINDNTVAPSAGRRIAQFLQNMGRSNVAGSVFMAQELAQQGVVAARHYCADSEFGCNPYAGGSVFNVSKVFPLLSDGITRADGTAGNTTGWIPPLGRYNHFVNELYAVNATTQGASTPALRDTYSGSLLEMAVTRAAKFGAALWGFTHEITDLSGVEPSSNNSGTMQWRGLLSDLDRHTRDGKLIVISPSEHYAITYGRSDDMFVRWDGEWVYRHDPTKIAF